MATTRINLPVGTWVKVMDPSDTAFMTIDQSSRIKWKRAAALPTDPLDPDANTAGHEYQINASATQETFAITRGQEDGYVIVNDD